MNCERYQALLAEYLDETGAGDPPADSSTRAELDGHLARCARCRALAADLRAIHAAAGALEPHVPPPEVWRRIADRVESARSARWWVVTPDAWSRWRPLATAAAVVVIAVVGWVAWSLPPRGDAPQAAGAGSSAVAPDGTPDDVRLAEQEYTLAIADLQAIAEDAGTELDPVTADVLQSSLTVIDNAIGESRAALDSEPTSAVAQDSLLDALRVKVSLLQDTIALINEMRKGDPEGTARILTELNQ